MTPERDENGFQGPTSGHTARTYEELFSIVTHPAFRLGVLDAKTGRVLDHDQIGQRILAETPAGSLKRLGVAEGGLFEQRSIAMAQYRYEEGRLFFLIERPKIKAWGYPDFPPTAIRDYLRKRCEPELKALAQKIREDMGSGSIVQAMRGATAALPLIAAPGPAVEP